MAERGEDAAPSTGDKNTHVLATEQKSGTGGLPTEQNLATGGLPSEQKSGTGGLPTKGRREKQQDKSTGIRLPTVSLRRIHSQRGDTTETSGIPSNQIHRTFLNHVRRSVKQQVRTRWFAACRKIRLAYRVMTVLAQSSFFVEKDAMTFIEMGDSCMDETTRARQLHATLKDGLACLRLGAREIQLTARLQFVMEKPVKDRSTDDVASILSALQRVSGFCDFPLLIQQQIARHGHLLTIGPQRVIVRQGHVAVNWYFVVCGQGMVTEVTEWHEDGVTKTRRTRTVLSKGMSFGELGLLNNAPRACSVTSRRPMQLVALSRTAFLEVFQKYPDDSAFISELEVMRHWPWETVLSRTTPTQWRQKYFRPNKLLVADSTNNDWIYIVKSGTCTVYQCVETERASWRDAQLYLAPLTINLDGWPVPRVETRQGEVGDRRSKYTLYKRLSSRGLLQADMRSRPPLKLAHRPPATSPAATHSTSPSLKLSSGREGEIKGGDSAECSRELRPSVLTAGDTRQGHVRQPTNADRKCVRVTDRKCVRVTDKEGRASDTPFLKSAFHTRKQYKVPQKRKPPRLPARHAREEAYTASGGPAFVVVDRLSRGDVFGIDQLKDHRCNGNTSPKVALVSEGAEVLMLRKTLYVSYMTDRCAAHIRQLHQPYTQPSVMRAKLRLLTAASLWQRKVVDEVKAGLRHQGHRVQGLYFQEPELPNPDSYLTPGARICQDSARSSRANQA